MGDNEQKAMALMLEAEKKMAPQKGFFGALFGCVWIFMINIFIQFSTLQHPYVINVYCDIRW